ncbi:MAG: transpeptidase family protein [Deltaproteobacteria bacterium]|nr:MAG: transpeptidase family protein [Deltaproteobacteria bacterium]
MKKRNFQKDIGKRQRRQKMAVLGVFFVFAFLAISYRCVFLHLSDDPKLARRAQTQYIAKIEEPPPRGNIFDADNEELAVSVPSYSVAVRPRRIQNKEKFLSSISPLLNMSIHDVSEKLDFEKKYVWLKRYVGREEKEKISQIDPKAIEMVKTSKRYYPNREVASQILGAVGPDNNGLSGLELFYDKFLKGGKNKSEAFRDARGKAYETEETLEAENVKEVNHVYLTTRKNIQYVTEKELNDVCTEHHAKSCSAIVIEPQTGAVLAMSTYPNFNPNEYQNYNLNTWRNLAVTDTFEPGSTFKTIMAAAALETGVVKSSEKFFCENGALKVGNNVIHDHEKYGMMNLREILKVSSNIGIYKVGKRVGKKAFGDIVSLFGFGKKTGIDYPGESSGFMRASSSWQDIEFANVSFGQGLRVTPLQMASSYATIANGGVRMRPYFVRKITDPSGNIIFENKPQSVSRVLAKKVADEVIDMMTEVTKEGGTATKAALPGYSVAGKTGTAQKFVNGAYSHAKFMSSFIGMVPAENPRFVIAVNIDEPQGVIYGGLVAAPVFKKIAWEALRDLGVAPTQPFEKPITEYARHEEKKISPSHVAEAEAVSEAAVQFSKNQIPDFRGLSKRRVIALLDQSGLEGEIVGTGMAVSQEPPPGTSIVDKKVKIIFSTQ